MIDCLRQFGIVYEHCYQGNSSNSVLSLIVIAVDQPYGGGGGLGSCSLGNRMLCGAFWDNLGVVLLAVQGNILLSATCIKYALHSHCGIPWISTGTFYCDKNQYGAIPHIFHCLSHNNHDRLCPLL